MAGSAYSYGDQLDPKDPSRSAYVVDWDVKESLNLRGVKIHCLPVQPSPKSDLEDPHNDVVATSFAKHVGHKLRGDRRS
jgi:hypothetical protein